MRRRVGEVGVREGVTGGSCHKCHFCRGTHVSVATKVSLLPESFGRDKYLSRQKFCHDKKLYLWRKPPKFGRPLFVKGEAARRNHTGSIAVPIFTGVSVSSVKLSTSESRFNMLSLLLLKYCFTSLETVGLLGTGAQDGHLDLHTAQELCL